MGINPVLIFSKLNLLATNWGGAMHLLHSLFSVPVNVYTTTRRLFAFLGELPEEGIPTVVDVPADAF